MSAEQAGRLTCRVARIHRPTSSLLVLDLEVVDGAPLTWSPGAHVDVRLPNGLERQYSLFERRRLIRRGPSIAVALADDSRGGSAYIHSSVRRGDLLQISTPSNHFPFDAAGPAHLVAGGIGITSLLSMAAEAERSGREWSMDYIGRSRASMPFLRDLKAYGSKVRVHETSVAGRPSVPLLIEWTTGTVFACGPSDLLRALEEACSDAGRPLRVERYEPAVDLASLPTPSFVAALARSGGEVVVKEGEPLVDALGRAGIDVPVSCRRGTCGNCQITVVDGAVDHRGSLLDGGQPAPGRAVPMLTCVSRAAGPRITLDL